MKKEICYETRTTVLGELTIVSDGTSITEISFGVPDLLAGEKKDTELLALAFQEITEYLSGARKSFDLPLSASGTEFQQEVWRALLTIPYGETRSYSQIAAQIGRPKAVRAVGMANHNNPLAIVVPCHRVIGKDGSLTGYGGGLDKKRFLLSLEQKH